MGALMTNRVHILAKWSAMVLAALAMILIVLNACGMMLWVFGVRNTLGVYSGVARLTVPDADAPFDRSASSEYIRVEWQAPVWRTGSWGWFPSTSRGTIPINRITPSGVPPPTNDPGFRLVQLPLWLFVMPGLASVPIWIVDTRRRSWRKSGRCASCGYAASPGVQCPECGAVAQGGSDNAVAGGAPESRVQSQRP